MYATTIATVIDRKAPKLANAESPGKVRSKTLTSFENLVYILPRGFESKNKIFALVTF